MCIRDRIEVVGFEPDEAYEYPPGNRKKRSPTPPAKAPVANRPPTKRQPRLAPDGFDFSKPYEPRGDIPNSPNPPPNPDSAHKPKKMVAALLGGIGKK